jgi:OFA family oxalate/formate antiporter-like MFS transporter
MDKHAESSVRVDLLGLPAKRWLQLIIGVVCMTMIANLQYGWTLFVNPIAAKNHWSLPAIQTAFTIFVATETWLVPVEGFLVDKFGPRIVTVVGGLLVAAGWSINSCADSLPTLYLGQAIGGIGAGAVYGTCVGNALKWFPDKRGLAAGITAAGFGAGSALTVIPISMMIESSGYEKTFLSFGLGQGVVIFLLAWFLKQPSKEIVAALPKPSVQRQRTAVAKMQRPHDAPQLSPRKMLKTPVFWVMYAMFLLMAAGGLFVTANLKPIAADFKVASVPVSLIGLTMPAVTFALTLDRLLNGVTRPFFGWVSDRIGRENTMFIAFFGEAIGILALSQLGANPVMFVVLSGMVFFAWGEIYSLFPSTCADTYGWKYASANAGWLYTAKGTASILVPFATQLASSSGWHMVFVVGAAMNLTAALMSLAVLKPMRRRMLAGVKQPEPVVLPRAKLVEQS